MDQEGVVRGRAVHLEYLHGPAGLPGGAAAEPALRQPVRVHPVIHRGERIIGDKPAQRPDPVGDRGFLCRQQACRATSAPQRGIEPAGLAQRADAEGDVGARDPLALVEQAAPGAVIHHGDGAEHLIRNETSALDFAARARWPLDADAAPVIGSGRLGTKA